MRKHLHTQYRCEPSRVSNTEIINATNTSTHYVDHLRVKKSFAMAAHAICCVLIMALMDNVLADNIPSLGDSSGPTIEIENRIDRLTSNMQVYLSPVTGRPIPSDHSDRVSQILSPIRAQSPSAASPLTVLTSKKEKGGKFVITGPHFRSHMQAGIMNGQAVGLCTVGAADHVHLAPNLAPLQTTHTRQ